MRNARGMDGEPDAGRGRNWSTRVASAISIRTRRARVVRPGRLAAGVSLWLLTTAALLCAGPSLAQATSSFYWYGENDSTCWQTGQLGSPSTACGEAVGPGFLSKSGSLKGGLAHMDEVSAGGSAEGIQLPDGNYCDYYKIGDDIFREESNNQGGVTGYTPPTPYKSYQESDPYGNVCQADGATWGQEVGTGDPSNNCYNTCGMHHIVSLHELSDHPWAGWFGEPSLAVSAEALAHTVTFSGESAYNMAWGYVCPLLEDTTTGYILEYCFEEWRSVYNPPQWKEERIGTCGPNGYDTVVTYFWPGTKLATEQGGSANTFEFSGTPSGWTHFAAAITKTNLLTSIDLAKEPPTKSGCGTNFSTNPEQYALVGVEQGVEGEHKLSGIGGAGRNLQVRTEYTQLPPEASTSAASSVTEEQATLNGTVNPKGTTTHYYFQYGETTAYGSSTSEGNAGSSTSSVPENATVTGLQAGTTYHYRIVASSAGGTSYGADQTFTTQEPGSSSRWAIRDPATGDQWAYFVGNSDGRRMCYWQSAPKWEDNCLTGETVAEDTSPAAIREADAPSGKGYQWAFFVGSAIGRRVCYWQETPTWEDNCLTGETVAEDTSPSVVRDPTTGDQWAYFVGNSDGRRMCYWQSAPKWEDNCLTGETVAEDTSPAAIREADAPSGKGYQWAFFVGSAIGRRVCYWQETPTWEDNCLTGETVAEDTSPSVVRDPTTGDQWAYFVGNSDGRRMCYWQSAPKWEDNCLTGETVAEDTSPSVVRDPTTGDQWVYFVGAAEGGRVCYWQSAPKWEDNCLTGEKVAKGTSPAAMREPGAPGGKGYQWAFFVGSAIGRRVCYWQETPTWEDNCLTGETVATQ